MYTIEQETTDKNMIPPIALPEYDLRDNCSSSLEECGSQDNKTRGLICRKVVKTDSLKKPEISLASNAALLTSHIPNMVVLIAGASKRAEFEKVVKRA